MVVDSRKLFHTAITALTLSRRRFSVCRGARGGVCPIEHCCILHCRKPQPTETSSTTRLTSPAGTRTLIEEGPNVGYAEFGAPVPKSDWRQNIILVFLVKVVLTTIPVLMLRLIFLRPWLRSLLRHATPPRCVPGLGCVRQTILHAGWFTDAGSGLHYFSAAVVWSVIAAAIIVLLWTLFRLIRPRT